MSDSSTIEALTPQHQVFITFQGADIPHGFFRHLEWALKRYNINVFVNWDYGGGQKREAIFKSMIEKSKIAIVFFSGKYIESTWSLRDLIMITDLVEKGQLLAIPIFYNLDPSTANDLRVKFGDALRHMMESDATKTIWKKAFMSIPSTLGIVVNQESYDSGEVIEVIVGKVRRVLEAIPSETVTDRIRQRFKDLGEKLGLRTIEEGLIIIFLLLLFSCLLYGTYVFITLLCEGGVAIYRVVVDVPKVLEYIPPKETEDTIINDMTCEAKPDRSSSPDVETNADFLDRTLTNSLMDSIVMPPQIQVFINFRGAELRETFVKKLVKELEKSKVNFFIDTRAQTGENLDTLFKRIEDSGIAIVVFSTRYTESEWCLEELVKINERVDEGLLKVVPIFYNVTTADVKMLTGEFGNHLRVIEYNCKCDEPKIRRWKKAIDSVSKKFALVYNGSPSSPENDAFVKTTVKKVLEMLQIYFHS